MGTRTFQAILESFWLSFRGGFATRNLPHAGLFLARTRDSSQSLGMTGLLVFWGLVLAWVGAGCVAQTTVTAAVLVTETRVLPSPTLTETPLPIQTESPLPTITLTPTKTPPPFPTPLPTPVWADWVGTPIRLDNDFWEWSPTANELAFYECEENENLKLIVAIAPTFTSNNISPEGMTCNFSNLVNNEMIWRPDGQQIIYSIPISDEVGEAWIIGRDGSNAYPLNIEKFSYRWLKFVAWMDNNTLVEWGYIGLPTFIGMLDIPSGEIVASAFFWGHEYRPNSSYIPGTLLDMGYSLFVITRDPNEVPNPPIINSQYVRMFPGYGTETKEHIQTLYEDWLPGTNQMLVYWASDNDYFDETRETTKLLLWNVDTDHVELVAPNGIGGGFSPDGTWLAYVTYGTQQLDAELKPIEDEALLQNPEMGTYLQLMNTQNRQVILSLPAFAQRDEQDALFSHFKPVAEFSSNDRYLAFITPGELQINGADWPIGIDPDSSTSYLHILDLETQQVIISTDIASPTE
ncbi:MAG: PD40 domain-containing protein [Anaerolineales bacterium]|nr:PD40 domain-containing protein [Anaerolineales bacterium]